MKSKLTVKILGVVVTIATLASLLVGITAAPVSAAAPGALAFTTTSTPNKAGNVMIVSTAKQPSIIAVSPDGNTIFAYDAVNKLMQLSTNAGVTFNNGVAVGANSADIFSMAVSPQFATDKLAVLTEGDASGATLANNHVYRTTDGGATWVDVANASLLAQIGPGSVAGDAVTSCDISYYYQTPSTPTIAIGVSGTTAGVTSNVLLFPGNFSWNYFGALANPVFAVKFAPNPADTELMAVYTNAGSTYITGSVTGTAFETAGTGPFPRTLLFATAVTSASIAIASDYVANSGANILVGVSGATNGVYRVSGRNSASVGLTSPSINTAAVPVVNVVVAGPTATAVAYFGESATVSSAVYHSAAWTTSTPAWTAAAKAPTGSATAATVSTTVAVGGTFVYAMTSAGAGRIDCALSRSADNGADFNQISLVDVGVLASVSFVTMKVVDANTMFVILNDTSTTAATANSVWKTMNAGTSWERIATGNVTTTLLSISPAYATDSTLVIGDTASAIVKKSTNGGMSFANVPLFVNPNAIYVAAGGNFYVGGTTANTFYKAGVAISATGITGTVKSIAFNPADATGATLAVGTTAGTVFQSTNTGSSFTQVGSGVVATGAAALMVTYGPDGTLYAGEGVNLGYYRWGTAWSAILSPGVGVTGLAVSTGNVLYMSSTTGAAGNIYRTLGAPTATTTTLTSLIYGGSGYLATQTIGALAVISGTAANTIYALDTSAIVGTLAGNGYIGAIIGFSDTMLAAATLTAPANGSVVAGTTSTTISWPAITGAHDYLVTLKWPVASGTASYTDEAVGTATSVILGDSSAPTANLRNALIPGTTYTWSVRVGAVGTSTFATFPFFSLPSTNYTFITALSTVNPIATVLNPAQGAVNVDVVNTNFTWPALTGTTGVTYQFVLAQDLGTTDKFAIIDYSDNTPTNAVTLQETLLYSTQYWWRVRAVTATSTSDWTTFMFTTAPKPTATVVTTSGPTTTAPVPTIILPTVTLPGSTVIITTGGPATGTSTPAIPTYILWAVIAVGAVLVIAVIVLIVRTRRIP
jgi:hypothetical protein